MRKVLTFLTALLLLVTPAVAELAGSGHDFSGLGADICYYCHSADNSIGGLGRRTYTGETPFITELYESSSMDHKMDINRLNNSDAPLCLVCHEDLHIGHPVGFVFDPSLDKDLKMPTSAKVTFGPNRNEMWCSSCHNPHGGATGSRFLARSNETSGLCFDCHVK